MTKTIRLRSDPQHQSASRWVILPVSVVQLTSSPCWYSLINVGAIQSVMCWVCFILNHAIDAHNHDAGSPSAWAAAGIIDLSACHSGREGKVVNKVQQLEEFYWSFCCSEAVAHVELWKQMLLFCRPDLCCLFLNYWIADFLKFIEIQTVI